MKKFQFLAAVLLIALLAACGTPKQDGATSVVNDLQISAKQVDLSNGFAAVKELSAIRLTVDAPAGERVQWTLNNGKLSSDNYVSFNDTLGHDVVVLVPNTSITTSLSIQAATATAVDNVTFNVSSRDLPERRLVFLTGQSMLLTEANASRSIKAVVINAKNEPIAEPVTFTSSNPQIIAQAQSIHEATVSSRTSDVASTVITARAGDLQAHMTVSFAELHDNVQFLDGAAILERQKLATDEQSFAKSIITLQANAHNQNLKVGDLIVADADYGIADRITSVSHQADAVVLGLEKVAPQSIYKSYKNSFSAPVAQVTSQLFANGTGLMTTQSMGGEILSQQLIDQATCKSGDSAESGKVEFEGTDITVTTQIDVVYNYEVAPKQTDNKFKLAINADSRVVFTAGKMSFTMSGDHECDEVALGNTVIELDNTAPYKMNVIYTPSVKLSLTANKKFVVDNGLSFTQTNRFEMAVEHDKSKYSEEDHGWQESFDDVDANRSLNFNVDADKLAAQNKNFRANFEVVTTHTFRVNVYAWEKVKEWRNDAKGCPYFYENDEWVAKTSFKFAVIPNRVYFNLRGQVSEDNNANDDCTPKTVTWSAKANQLGELSLDLMGWEAGDSFGLNCFLEYNLQLPRICFTGNDNDVTIDGTYYSGANYRDPTQIRVNGNDNGTCSSGGGNPYGRPIFG